MEEREEEAPLETFFTLHAMPQEQGEQQIWGEEEDDDDDSAQHQGDGQCIYMYVCDDEGDEDNRQASGEWEV